MFLSFFCHFRGSPSEPVDQGCDGDEEQHTDPENTPCDTEVETPLDETEQHIQKDSQVCGRDAV